MRLRIEKPAEIANTHGENFYCYEENDEPNNKPQKHEVTFFLSKGFTISSTSDYSIQRELCLFEESDEADLRNLPCCLQNQFLLR